MGKMKRGELGAMRERARRAPSPGGGAGPAATVRVGMGSCGIAAGAREALDAFREEVARENLESVEVTQAGCMGLCYSEPTVLVRVAGMPDAVYGGVDADTARRIVQEHLIHRRLVDGHVFDRPAADLMAGDGRQRGENHGE